MREIKFRAWSIKDNSYINGCNMYGFVLGQGAPEEKLERYDSSWKKGEFLLEQFTGLKDKNGNKDGFDGDIVSFGETRPKYQIKWSVCNAEFYLESIDEQKDILHISNLIVGEIIGNVHENPELLGD